MFIYQIVTFFQEPLISRMLGDVHFDSLSLKTLRKNGLIFSVARVYDDELLPPWIYEWTFRFFPPFCGKIPWKSWLILLSVAANSSYSHQFHKIQFGFWWDSFKRSYHHPQKLTRNIVESWTRNHKNAKPCHNPLPRNCTQIKASFWKRSSLLPWGWGFNSLSTPPFCWRGKEGSKIFCKFSRP